MDRALKETLREWLGGYELPRKEEEQVTAETMTELSDNKGEDDDE